MTETTRFCGKRDTKKPSRFYVILFIKKENPESTYIKVSKSYNKTEKL
jgi:hypothetical protein